MALYNRAAEVVLSLKPSKAPGWVIYCDWTNGSDSTGDGTESRPYKTINTGSADLRSGKGDTLVVRPGQYVETPTVISNKSDINIVGFASGTTGARLGEAGGGRRHVNDISAWAAYGTYGFTATVTAGHGLQVGDYVMVANVYSADNNYVNGFHEVAGISATSFSFFTNYAVSTGSYPIGAPGSLCGSCVPVPLAIKGCNSVIVTGLEINYTTALDGDKMACMCFDAGNIVTGVNVGNNILFARNSITAGCVGFSGFRNSPQISSGNNLQVEENAFAIGGNSIFPWQINEKVGALYISGGSNFVVNRNTFSYTNIFGMPGPWSPDGVIQYTDKSPAIGHLHTSNSFAGVLSITRTKLFMLWNDWNWQNPPIERIFVRRNTYADIQTVTPQTVSTDQGFVGTGPLIDREPETLIDESFLPTQTDVIWQAPREELASFPGTAGETQALAVYGDRIHFDSDAAGSGTTVGVDGTPDNPVNDEADARTLSTSTGIRTIFVEGTFTLATDWEKFSFEGAAPERSIIMSVSPHSLNNSEFSRCGIRGDISGSIATVECLIGGVGLTVTGVQGTFKETGFNGTIQIADGGRIQGLDLASQATTGATTIDFNSGDGDVVGEMKGLWAVANITNTADVNVVYALAGGQLWLKNTVNGGNFILLGQGEIYDQAVSKGIFSDNVLRGSRLDITVSDLQTLINNLENISSADVTAAVWGVTEAALASAGAAGLLVAIGLSRNTIIDFSGDDALGWQLVVNDTAGSEIARADLYDEAFARIPAAMTVPAFIAAKKSIAKVVPS